MKKQPEVDKPFGIKQSVHWQQAAEDHRILNQC